MAAMPEIFDLVPGSGGLGRELSQTARGGRHVSGKTSPKLGRQTGRDPAVGGQLGRLHQPADRADDRGPITRRIRTAPRPTKRLCAANKNSRPAILLCVAATTVRPAMANARSHLYEGSVFRGDGTGDRR